MAKKTKPKPEDEQVATQQPNNKQDAVPEPVELVVISAQGLNLRAEPSMDAAVLGALIAGTVLTRRIVTEAAPDGWLAVQTKTGKEGYVRMEYVAVME